MDARVFLLIEALARRLGVTITPCPEFRCAQGSLSGWGAPESCPRCEGVGFLLSGPPDGEEGDPSAGPPSGGSG